MKETLSTLENSLKDIIGSSVQECFALYDNIFKVQDLPGQIVEIGCLYGRTSIPIILAAKELGQKAVCIDHLFQYPDLETCTTINQSYPNKENIEDAFSKNTYLEFTKNIIKRDLFEDVVIIASKSEGAYSIWREEIKFLFIDADHSYEGVKRDFNMFEPFVVKNGLIAMHDIDPNGHPGVFKFFNELMGSGRFSIQYNGEGTSLRIIQKVKE